MVLPQARVVRSGCRPASVCMRLGVMRSAPKDDDQYDGGGQCADCGQQRNNQGERKGRLTAHAALHPQPPHSRSPAQRHAQQEQKDCQSLANGLKEQVSRERLNSNTAGQEGK